MSTSACLRLRLALAVLVGLLAAAPALAQDALPLKRVLLSTGGVGYFEHEATVDGDAELPLTVRLAQVDDVLKSLVVYDDRGGVGTIHLPGREPLQQAFRDLPFRGDALQSPVTLLSALTGTEIRVKGVSAVQGRVLGVTPEEVVLPNGLGRTTRHRVGVMVAGEGLRQFLLEEVDQIEFVDPTLSAELTGALAAINQYRVQDRRTLLVSLRGTGRRTVRVGYVVEAPLWKTSYRLTVPRAGAGGVKGLLQGWAVVENTSGQDWRGVELTLSSGAPVTFRQPLYTAYYVPRPEVPVEVMGRVLPRVDTGALKELEARLGPSGASAPGAAAAMPPASAGAGFAAARRSIEVAAPAPPAEATVTEEATTQVLFRVAEPVTLGTGQSAIIPVINREIPTRRVALYDATASPLYPLAAVELTNDAQSGLPPGALTLYEQPGGPSGGGTVYVGDARLGTLPAGERRLVSFAVEQKVQVVRETKSREAVAGGTISRGVFRLTTLDAQTTLYRVKAPALERRALIVEHPRQPDWRLVLPPEKDVDLTRDRYRIHRALEPGAAITIEVTVERPRTSSLELATLPTASFVGFARTGALDARVRQAFEALAVQRADIDREERGLAELEASRKAILEEQGRLRANLGSVPGTGDLRQRYLGKLKQQEDQLEQLQAGIESARRRLGDARERLAAAIGALEL